METLETFEFYNRNHKADCLISLNKLRTEGVLCDVILHIDDRCIHAHRNILASCSPYFYIMFAGAFPESSQNDISLKLDFDFETLELVVNYIYTGSLAITSENVQNLMITASFLQIPWILDNCSKFLKQELDTSNCVGIRRIADRLSLKDLSTCAQKFASSNFQKLISEDEYFSMEFQEILELVSYPHSDYNDDLLLKAILLWVEFCPEERKIHINNLLNFVNPNLVTQNLVSESQFFAFNIVECHEWKEQALKNRVYETCVFFLDKMGSSADLNKFSLETGILKELEPLPQKALAVSLVKHNNNLYATGGSILRKSSKNFFRYSIYKNKWTLLSSLRLARSHHRSCVVNSNIFSIGGTGYSGESLSSVEKMDIETGIATGAGFLNSERTSFGAVSRDNCLYIMGGENDNQSLKTLEFCDPRIGEWSELCDMSDIRSYCTSCSIKDHIYCAEGVANFMERYDIRNNHWETIDFACKEMREIFELFTIGNELHSISGDGVYKYDFINSDWSPIFSFQRFRDWDTALSMELTIL